MLKPVSLQVEYKNNPIGMDEITPRFFYRLEGNGGEQLARRLTVALADGTPVWDSGWVDSGITIQIPYSGPALRPFTDYRWQVSVRDDRGDVSESAEARFETGFMGTPWQGKWISSHCASGDSLMHGVQQLFRDFEVPEDLVSARLYAAALGLYEARLNGENITEDIFAPGFTDYYERIRRMTSPVNSAAANSLPCRSTWLTAGIAVRSPVCGPRATRLSADSPASSANSISAAATAKPSSLPPMKISSPSTTALPRSVTAISTPVNAPKRGAMTPRGGSPARNAPMSAP